MPRIQGKKALKRILHKIHKAKGINKRQEKHALRTISPYLPGGLSKREIKRATWRLAKGRRDPIRRSEAMRIRKRLLERVK